MHNYQENQPENFPHPAHNQTPAAPVLPFAPNNPPWNSLMAFGAWVLSIFFLIVSTNLFVGVYFFTNNPGLSSTTEIQNFLTTDPTALLVQITSVIPAHIMTIILAWAIITRFNKYSFTEMIGWRWGGFNIFYIIGIVVAFYALAGLLTWYFGEQNHELTKILKSSRSAVFIVAFMATFTAPLVEEVIYRGILYSAFQRTFGVSPAVIAVTALFAGVHFIQYWNSPVALLLVTLLSLVLTLIRVKSGNLLPCIVLHTIFNGVQSLLLIVEPYVNRNTPSDTQAIVVYLLK